MQEIQLQSLYPKTLSMHLVAQNEGSHHPNKTPNLRQVGREFQLRNRPKDAVYKEVYVHEKQNK